MREAVILAGGLATRLGEVAASVPKVLQPVAGAPFLDHLLWNLGRHGQRHVVLAVGRLGEQVEAHVAGRRYHGIDRIDVSFETEALGTGGAVTNALPLLGDEFLVVNGDTLFDVNYLDLEKLLDDSETKAAVALRRVDDASRYGSVTLAGDRITGFAEKSCEGAGLISGGVLALKAQAFADAPQGFWQLETELLPALASAGQLAGREYDAYFVDIGIPEDLKRADTEVAQWRSKPLVILDRDGVINEDRDWVHTPDEFAWMPDASAAIKWLNDSGFLVAVVTNQAGIARGLYTEDDYARFERWIDEQLARHGAHVDIVFHCPHHPDPAVAQDAIDCDCRKPKPGMVFLAMEWAGASAGESVLIGNSESDMQAARAAEVRGVLYEGGSLLAAVKLAAKPLLGRLNYRSL